MSSNHEPDALVAACPKRQRAAEPSEAEPQDSQQREDGKQRTMTQYFSPQKQDGGAQPSNILNAILSPIYTLLQGDKADESAAEDRADAHHVSGVGVGDRVPAPVSDADEPRQNSPEANGASVGTTAASGSDDTLVASAAPAAGNASRTATDYRTCSAGESFDPFYFIKSLPPLPPNHAKMVKCILPRQTRTGPQHTLVLDLDETLVHCSTEQLHGHEFTFPVTFNSVDYRVYVRRRPYFEHFLQAMSKIYEIVVFTASQKVYADRLLNILDPDHKWIKYRLFRDSCHVVDGNYLKDLTVLGRDFARTIIVDNSPQAFGFQLDNGVPIETWTENPADQELLQLIPFLEVLSRSADVRPEIKEKFRLWERVRDSTIY